MPPKRRRKLHGLYYHTSPPKVLPMNGISGGGTKHNGTGKEAFVVKPSSIRIWIHERDVGKLTRLLWTGQANRLRREVSTHPKVRKFLQMVPYIMNNIRDVHQNTVENDAGSLQANLEPPVPPSIVTAKDQNGLTIVHKAAGLGHSTIVQTILDIWPDGVNDTDGTGKTPLHWAASAKNNSYCYNLLVSAGADEDALDFKMKTPAYYKNKQHDIDRSLLTVLPEAPRVSQEIKTDWSAIVDEIGNLNSENNNNPSPKKSNKIIGNGVNVLTSRSKANSLEDTSEAADLDNGDEKLTPEEKELLAAIDDPNFYRQLEEEEKARAAEAEQHEEHKNDEENVDGDVGDDDVNDNKDDVDDVDDGDDADDKTTAEDDDKDVNEKSDHDDDDLNANDDDDDDDDDEKTQQDNGNDDATANNDQNGNHVDVDNGQVDSAHDRQEHNDKNIHDEEHSGSVGNIENGEHDSVMGSPRKDDSNDSVNDSPKKEADDGAVESEDGKLDDDKPKDTIPVDEPKNDAVSADEPKNDAVSADEPKNDAVSVGESKNDTVSVDESKTDTPEDSNAASEPLVESQQVEGAEATNEEEKNQEEDKNKAEVKDEEKGQQKEEGDKSTEEDHVTEDVVKNGLDDVDAGGNVNALNGHHTEEGKEEESEVAKQETGSNHSGEDGKSQRGHEDDEATSEMNGNGDVGKDEEENKAEIDDNSSVKSMKINGENHEDSDKKNDKSDDIISNNQIITDDNIKSNHHKDDEETKSEEDDDDDEQDVNGEESKRDKNHNRVIKGETSPSPAMEIEGIVQGEPDNNQVQSQSGGFDVDEKSQMQSIIDVGDMEQLAAIVLNGEGKKLIGAKSKQPEIQAFLDNVSAYMNKIRRVHMAAREGSLRDLQAALDRRKFAIAKDEISPKGASPLHVSTIFGHASIVRYLGGRFPETTSAVDDDGRTALHYAAVIKDNGHFYNLLSHLGSNPKAVDKLGHTAEFYTNHEQSENILSHSQLLKSYGVKEDIEQEMLSDQVPDDVHSARRTLDDADILSTLERCFRLINEPYKASDPLGSATPSSASTLRLPIINYLSKFLKRSVFDKIKYRQTRLDHNLFDVIWPAMKKSNKERRIDEDLNAGIVAPDFDVYVVFQEFIVPLIKDLHCMNLSQEFKPHPQMFYFPLNDGQMEDHLSVNLDPTGKYISSGYVECSRNLDSFELPLNLNIGQLEQAERVLIEKLLSVEFTKVIDEEELGTYYTMNEVLENPSEIRTILAASKLLIPLLDHNDSQQEAESLAINGQYWPYGRGVFISNEGDFVAWVNVQDHLRLLACTPKDDPTDFGYAYSKVGRAALYLEENIHFRESYLLGYLSSRPSFLGTSLKISSTISLPNLTKEIDNLRHLCTVRGLNMISNELDGTVRVLNMQSLGVTEWKIFQDYCTAITNILQLEKDMSLTNSKQIAAMLVKIFRRKKNSLVEG